MGLLTGMLMVMAVCPVGRVIAGKSVLEAGGDARNLTGGLPAEMPVSFFGTMAAGHVHTVENNDFDKFMPARREAQDDIFHWRTEVYEAFITGKMDRWKRAVDGMGQRRWDREGDLLEVIASQYGYVAWCLGNNRKEAADQYLTQMEKSLAALKRAAGATAEYHAFYAAAYGFRIGLSLWKAPYLGPKSMSHANQALKTNPESWRAHMEMGNIWRHMPAVFGGSPEKALGYYLKAVALIEAQPQRVRTENWSYLNLLVTVGQICQASGDISRAGIYYRQTLEVEPRFAWVRNGLIPSLKKK